MNSLHASVLRCLVVRFRSAAKSSVTVAASLALHHRVPLYNVELHCVFTHRFYNNLASTHYPSLCEWLISNKMDVLCVRLEIRLGTNLLRFEARHTRSVHYHEQHKPGPQLWLGFYFATCRLSAHFPVARPRCRPTKS